MADGIADHEVITASGGWCAPMTTYYSFDGPWVPDGWPNRIVLFPLLDRFSIRRLRRGLREIRWRVSTAADVLRGNHECGDHDYW